jgi:hypothetical protein
VTACGCGDSYKLQVFISYSVGEINSDTAALSTRDRKTHRQTNCYISKTTGPIGSKINRSGSLAETNIL